MKNILLIATVALLSANFARAETVGFSHGNEFVSRRLVGHATLTCPSNFGGGSEFRSVYCTGEILDPNEFDYFVGHQGVDAEKVVLNAIHADGSSREKTEDFDSSTGRSKDTFNLWISSLTQRPLLDVGKNTVQYKLKKGGQSVIEGSFTANVARGETRQCAPGNYYSSNPGDCQFPEAAICDRYFYENHYCE